MLRDWTIFKQRLIVFEHRRASKAVRVEITRVYDLVSFFHALVLRTQHFQRTHVW